MATLALNNVKKTYAGGVIAVDGFTLDVDAGEFIIFVGPSGCGKSTTLRLVAGLEDIDAGEIAIDGVCVNHMAPKDRDIAMVFQNYALYPHMSVYDNMAFGLKIRKVPKALIDEKVREAARILDIEPLLARKPKALSGGQRQRVAMGRALVREPKVFLMDEPLSNLDAKLRVQMRAEISKLHQKLGATFIYVTHDQVEAMTLGTRIVVMREGVVQQVGTPKALYQTPANVFVAGFIGLPQMNFMRADVVTTGTDVVALRVAGGQMPLAPLQGERLHQGGYIGRQVILGIRPENIQPGAGAFEMEVEVVEMLGADMNFIGKIAGESVAVATRATESVSVGDRLSVTIDAGACHLFDCETEKRI